MRKRVASAHTRYSNPSASEMCASRVNWNAGVLEGGATDIYSKLVSRGLYCSSGLDCARQIHGNSKRQSASNTGKLEASYLLDRGGKPNKAA